MSVTRFPSVEGLPVLDTDVWEYGVALKGFSFLSLYAVRNNLQPDRVTVRFVFTRQGVRNFQILGGLYQQVMAV